MQFKVTTQNKFDGAAIMKRAGYHAHRDPYTGKWSFARRAGGEGHYPRYHAYLIEQPGIISVDLHLDQKKASYGGGTHAHAGEYDGRVVEEEAARIQKIVAGMMSAPEELEEEPKKGFFGKLFG